MNTDMKFMKFSSIENSYRKKYLDYLTEYGLTDGNWVVTEKAHGSNLSFWVNTSEVKLAKRSSFLPEDNNFYNSTTVFHEVKDKIKHVFNLCKSYGTTVTWIAVYGEIAGGNYPHPEVTKVPSAKKVQEGVYYSPANFFYAFDIYTDVHGYLPIPVVNKIFEETKIFYARTLFEGTLEECLTFPNDGQSTLPALFGLPLLDNNIMEGVVIRPEIPRFLLSNRVMIKNKNTKFSEKSKQCKIKEPIHLSIEATELKEELQSMVTVNRLNNVISHEGSIFEKTDFGKLMGLFMKDVMMDFLKDHKTRFEALDKKEGKILTKATGRASANLIRPRWQNIVDGEL